MASLTGQYNAGTAWKRKNWYGWAIIAGGLLVATGGVFGVMTLADVEGFVKEWAAAILVIGGAIQTITAAVARRNVEPPNEPRHAPEVIDHNGTDFV